MSSWHARMDDVVSRVEMYRISAPALAGLASGHFWQIRLQQNFRPDFRTWPDLADFSTSPVHVDYLQQK